MSTVLKPEDVERMRASDFKTAGLVCRVRSRAVSRTRSGSIERGGSCNERSGSIRCEPCSRPTRSSPRAYTIINTTRRKTDGIFKRRSDWL